MMLLTFEVFSDILGKKHIFYNKAFEVLLDRHDALKPGFKREFKTSIQEDEFRRCFAAFCLLSFLEQQFSFTKPEILKYAKDAIEFSEVKAKPSDFVNDLNKCVCIIVKDGEYYSFLHRSFQEYFTAEYLTLEKDDQAQEIYNIIYDDRIFAGEVFDLAAEMNAKSFEANFMKPKLDDLFEKIRKVEHVEVKVFDELICQVVERFPSSRVHREGYLDENFIIGSYFEEKPEFFLFLQIALSVYSRNSKISKKFVFAYYEGKLESVKHKNHQKTLAVSDHERGIIMQELYDEILRIKRKVDRISQQRIRRVQKLNRREP